METVEQISIPLARVFNLSLKEGVVPFEWIEANIIPLFKKGSKNKSENYRLPQTPFWKPAGYFPHWHERMCSKPDVIYMYSRI